MGFLFDIDETKDYSDEEKEILEHIDTQIFFDIIQKSGGNKDDSTNGW